MTPAERIRRRSVAPGQVALYHLGQAGFCLKTSAGTLIHLDAYLSDCCHRLFGFKRMSPPPVTPNEPAPDLVASTHAHADHLDPEALPLFARRPQTRFVGAPDCGPVYASAGIGPERTVLLEPGAATRVADVELRAVDADHGDLAPEAIGLCVTTGGITVYHTGDTGYAPERICPSLPGPVEVMIAPINGEFGNLNAEEACRLAAQVRPRVLIACHFWMFVEHGGDPRSFLAAAPHLAPGVTAVVMAPGEELLYSSADGIVGRWVPDRLAGTWQRTGAAGSGEPVADA